jgi:hypothetical protein
MELASMLAGEPFSDHPKSVSRPIASLLRGYNDLLGDGARQELLEYASRSVDTAASDEVERMRAARLIEWADAIMRCRTGWSILGRPRRREALRDRARIDPDSAGEYAVRAIRELSDDRALAVRSLIDELIAMGRPATPCGSPRGLLRNVRALSRTTLDDGRPSNSRA